MNEVISLSKSASKCVTFRFPNKKLSQLHSEAATKQLSLNSLFSQIIKEHFDLHSLASQAKLYYLPKSFLMRLINKFSEDELRELARQTAKYELVDICLFLKGGFSIASIVDIAETWLRISRMPYRREVNGDTYKIIIQHDMGQKYSYLIREISRYLLEVAFETRTCYDITDDTLVIKIDSFERQYEDKLRSNFV